VSDLGILHRRSENFGKSPAPLIHDLTITDGAARLYAHMHWRYGSNRDNHERVSKMAQYMGVSEATICKRIQELEAKDWVVTIERDFNLKTGKYQTPYYHVFELQEDCKAFREQYQPKDGERIAPKPEGARDRKSRKGVGGNPRLLNSSLPGNSSCMVPDNSSSTVPDNSSFNYLDSSDPDSVDPENTRAASDDAVGEVVETLQPPTNVVPFSRPTTREEHDAFHEAVEKAMSLKGAAYGLIQKYANFLSGRVQEKSVGRGRRGAASNGAWFEYQITPGMDVYEVYGFHAFMGSYHPTIGPLRSPETINDYVARFRAHPEHDALVTRMRNLMPLVKSSEPDVMPMAAGAENTPIQGGNLISPEQRAQAEAMFAALLAKTKA
jgi:hypothetical protein